MAEMRTVTGIEMQKRDAQRISIFLDGEFAFGLHQDVLLESGIARGDRLSEERIEAILALEQKRRANGAVVSACTMTSNCCAASVAP